MRYHFDKEIFLGHNTSHAVYNFPVWTSQDAATTNLAIYFLIYKSHALKFWIGGAPWV